MLTPLRRSRRKRRKAAGRLALKGWSQAAIAQRLGVDRSTVSRDLRRLAQDWEAADRRLWRTESTADLERIAAVERTLWQAWEDSKNPPPTVWVRRNPATGGVSVHSSRVESSPGDPRCMSLLVKCVELQRTMVLRMQGDRYRRPSEPEMLRLIRLELATERLHRRWSADPGQEVSDSSICIPDVAGWETYPTAGEPAVALEGPAEPMAAVEDVAAPVALPIPCLAAVAARPIEVGAGPAKASGICTLECAAAPAGIRAQHSARPALALLNRYRDFAWRSASGVSAIASDNTGFSPPPRWGMLRR